MDEVAAVRAFNRFYTQVIGVIGEGMLRTPYSLTETRVIFELAQCAEAVEVAEIRRALDLDAGYLSRMLARFEGDGLVTRERSAADSRRQVTRLTPAGREVFAKMDAASSASIEGLLDGLTADDRRRLLGAMGTIRRILDGTPPQPRSYVLRPLRAGDYGWVVERNGALYAQEYGWGPRYEALVARIVADYIGHHDPKRENAWIAEVDGEPVGAIFCVRKEDAVAQLRLLHVEPAARGMGIGGRLVAECVRFAREAGYAEMMLWTNSVLAAARRIYEKNGFEFEAEEPPEDDFGAHTIGDFQFWRRRL